MGVQVVADPCQVFGLTVRGDPYGCTGRTLSTAVRRTVALAVRHCPSGSTKSQTGTVPYVFIVAGGGPGRLRRTRRPCFGQ